VLFDVKDAWLYQPKSVTVSPGASEYRAENPPFGAVFTFYLKEDLQSLAQLRKEQEKDLQGMQIYLSPDGKRLSKNAMRMDLSSCLLSVMKPATLSTMYRHRPKKESNG
jgi:hypothetical protein